MRTELENTDFQPSTASEQELKFGDTCFVPVLERVHSIKFWHPNPKLLPFKLIKISKVEPILGRYARITRIEIGRASCRERV